MRLDYAGLPGATLVSPRPSTRQKRVNSPSRRANLTRFWPFLKGLEAMTNQKREFSILKWIVFPLTSLLLAAVIAWFNLRVFGYEDGAPYLVVVGLIAFFSIVINKYTNSENRGLALAAFVCEIFLTAALIANAAWSLSIQRNMSVAKQGEASRKAEMEEIRKLDRRAQRDAVRQMGKRKGAQDTFAQYEQTLFWIMVGEMMLYGVCAFSLFGLAQIVERTEAKVVQADKNRDDEQKKRSHDVTADATGPEWRERPAPQFANGEDKSKRKFDSH